MLSSGSLAAPWSVKDAPPVDVHSTVWSAPAAAEGGWFTSVPSAETSTVIVWLSFSANSHGPPTSSQSGESAVHAVAPSPAQVPSGFSPSAVGARLPCKSQSRAPQSMPSVSGAWFEPAMASPFDPRRPLPVPPTPSFAKTASTPASIVVERLSADALRSLKVGSEWKRTEKVMGSIASPKDAATWQPPPGHGSPRISTVPTVSGSWVGSRSPTSMWLEPSSSHVLRWPNIRYPMVSGEGSTAEEPPVAMHTGSASPAWVADTNPLQPASLPFVMTHSKKPLGSKFAHELST